MRARHRWMQCGVPAAFYFGTVTAAAQDSAPVELPIEINEELRTIRSD